MLKYKAYSGTVEYSAGDEILYGKIIGIRDAVTFEGDMVTKLKKAFKEAVNDYIETCKRLGRDIDKEYKKALTFVLNQGYTGLQ